MEDGLRPLDWAAPWLTGWRETGERVAAAVSAGLPLHEALNLDVNAQPGASMRFVAQQALPEGEPYERFIFREHACPTRDNLHDFFNGLCWLKFPQAKRQLNALQAAQIEARGIQPVRGPVRDAATVFDENAALLHAPPPLWDALEQREWTRLFVELRPLWQQARLVLFGHALLEKLAAPRKHITAHVWRAQAPLGSLADLDAWLASQLSAPRLAAKPFVPLPVLGIPGWWHQNENFSFYDDSLVFRPRRAS